MQEIKQALSKAAQEIYGVEVEVELSRPDEEFGDYASNIALQLAGQLGKAPREIAETLAAGISGHGAVSEAVVAGPGFINFRLTDESLIQSATDTLSPTKQLDGQEVLVEFGDPNPFKEMHIGHLYSYIVGDSICRLLENRAATVRRLSYHGDVGLHVAKAVWGLKNLPKDRQLGEYYAAGAKAYEQDESAKVEIEAINESIYIKDDQAINSLYETGRTASFEYFDTVLKQIGVTNDKRYLESETAEVGVNFVRQYTGAVFKESEGAIIYDGEKIGLHTRVFITSKGLPTYEAKDLGLAKQKQTDYPDSARSIIITAHEQSEYFRVMLAALSEIDKALADKTEHLTHGFLSLSTGKMSSRTGEVYSAGELLETVQKEAIKKYPEAGGEIKLAAIKYGLLKHRLGSDIVYDIGESISLEGNSGPYLQYAHARAASIIAKAGDRPGPLTDLDPAERSLALKISEYKEILDRATDGLMPHLICNYLYELSQKFNNFYEHNRVIGSDRQSARLSLVATYAAVLKDGLGLLGINAPERV